MNDLVSGGRADKLRTCEVCACNETIIVIRAEQMSVQRKQLQTMSIREFSSLWWQTDYREWHPLRRQGCLIWCQHQLCTDILTTLGKRTQWKHSMHLTEVCVCVCEWTLLFLGYMCRRQSSFWKKLTLGNRLAKKGIRCSHNHFECVWVCFWFWQREGDNVLVLCVCVCVYNPGVCSCKDASVDCCSCDFQLLTSCAPWSHLSLSLSSSVHRFCPLPSPFHLFHLLPLTVRHIMTALSHFLSGQQREAGRYSVTPHYLLDPTSAPWPYANTHVHTLVIPSEWQILPLCFVTEEKQLLLVPKCSITSSEALLATLFFRNDIK